MLGALGYPDEGTLAQSLIVYAWLGRCLARLVMMMVIVPNVPACNGIRVFVPEYLKAFLTPQQLRALYHHEEGHLVHGHAWFNYALDCLFIQPSTWRRIRQELEADDHAVVMGYGRALAQVLRERSTNPFDLWRAERLECICSKH